MPDLTRLHEELAHVMLAGRELTDVLGDVVAIARRALPAAEAASITLIRSERPFTAAYDGRMALDADELQYERGYGPCLDAGRAGQVFVIEDMATETRWPDYARHAAEHGVGSSLSVPLPLQGTTVGALDTYARRPRAFGDDERVLGEEVAAWVALALGNAAAAPPTLEELEQLRTAMASRALIEQAKGVLAERHKVSADAAFTLLTRAAQRTHRPLRDVAAELVRTGTFPGPAA